MILDLELKDRQERVQAYDEIFMDCGIRNESTAD